MVHHFILIHDDDWTETAANIAAADFADGEDRVLERPGLGVPTLRGIHMGVYGLSGGVQQHAIASVSNAYVTLMPHTWKETEKITRYADVDGVYGTDSGGYNVTPKLPYDVDAYDEGFSVQTTKNMNWVNSGDSQIAVSTGSACDAAVGLHYQYGAPVPSAPNEFPTIVINKQATADVTADTWSSVCNEKLDDDGLDPDATYRVLWGMVMPEGPNDTLAIAWRARAVGGSSDCYVGGLGTGPVAGPRVKTWFKEDSITFEGDAQFKAEAICSAACKPKVRLGLQQISGGSAVSKGATPRPRQVAGPSPRPSLGIRRPGLRFRR